MTAAEWETRRMLRDPMIRHVLRQLVSDARHAYVRKTAKAELEIASHDPTAHCRRCGHRYERNRWNKQFCSESCRKRFNDITRRDYRTRWEARKRVKATA